MLRRFIVVPFFCALSVLPCCVYAESESAPEPVAIPKPAPVEIILGKDVTAWIIHLKRFENEFERKKALVCLAEFGPDALDAVPELRALLKEELQPEVQRFSIMTLGAIGPAAKVAVPELLAVLADTQRPLAQRAAAVSALAQIQPETPAVRKAILLASHAQAVELRAEALNALVTLALYEPQALPTLTSALSIPNDAEVAANALLCLGDAGVDPVFKTFERATGATRLHCIKTLGLMGAAGFLSAESTKILSALLKAAHKERDAAVKEALLQAVTRIAPNDPAVLALQSALKPTSKAERDTVLEFQAPPKHEREEADKKTDVELLKLFKSPQPEKRLEAAEALRFSRNENVELIQALILALKDSSENVRIAAARSLVRYGKYTHDALPIFTEWLESENIARRKAALIALAGMGPDARPALAVVVAVATSPSSDDDKELRQLLAMVLRMIGPDAATHLVETFKSPEASTRARAARAVASMKDVGATALPDLIELSKSAVDSDAEAGFAALGTMGSISYAMAGRHLTQTLREDAFAPRRKWATWALGEIKIPPEGDTLKVIDALMEALLDTDPAVCRGAHGALVRIGAPALPRLRELLRVGTGESPYWAVRVMARLKADPGDVIPRLAELSQPGKLAVERGVAAELLGEYAPEHPEIIPVLLRALADREEFVAHAATRSLALFKEQSIPPVKELLKQRNPLLRKRAIEALGALRTTKN